MLNRELITKAIKEVGLECKYSCCGIPNKFCESDEWRGNLEGFANAIIRLFKESENESRNGNKDA